MSFKVIVFDLGGVFVELDITKFFKEVFSPFQLNKPRTPFMLKFFKQSDNYHMGEINNDEFYHLACDILNLDKKHITKDRFFKAFNSILTRIDKDMVKLLEELKNMNKFKLFCLSNINESHWEYLKNKNCGFLDHFDSILLSHEIGMLKPDKKVFEYVIQLAKCKPNKVLFIDDGLKNVQSAEELGIVGLEFNSVDHLRGELKKLGINLK
ncbi:MAG: HAD family phosphatase [Promethearchaeota archaeon]|nr:MAG: HAD family phosphatase [Candidatus Lokiarchaeota archaeon]